MLYPVMLDLDGADVLVVGGGRVAGSKAANLARCGARVTVIAPQVGDEARHHAAVVLERPVQPQDVQGRRFVVTATGVPEIDGAVSEAARQAGIWVNAADDPEHCSAILPAVLRRGPVVVSVSTSGVSPALASFLRDRLGDLIGPEVAVAAERLGGRRTELHRAGLSTEGRSWHDEIVEALRSAGAVPALWDGPG